MRAFLLGVPIALLGCDAIAPSYDSGANQQVTTAYGVLAQILAKADLGAFTSKSSYTGQINAYAMVLGDLQTAKVRIEGDAPSNKKLPAYKANQLLVGVIEGCISEVKSFSDLHKQFGIPANSGATQPVRVACDETVRAVGARGPNGENS